MKKGFILRAISVLFILVLLIGCKKIPKFDHYGVYIKDKYGFKEITGFKWTGINDFYKNTQNYNQIPKINKNQIEMYAYFPQAKIMKFKLQETDLKNENGKIVRAKYAIDFNRPKTETVIEKINKRDDILKIKSQIDSEFIILVSEGIGKDIGYLFSKKNKLSKKYIRQSILWDLRRIASLAEVYYKTPISHGGAGKSWSSGIDSFGKSLSYYSYNASTKILTTRYGSLIFALNTNNTVLTIIGIGDKKGKDRSTGIKITLTISGEADVIEVKTNN